MIWSNRTSLLAITILVVAVAIFDLRERRIPNFLTFPSILFGIAWNTFGMGLTGASYSLKGLGAGAGVLLIPYLAKGMKAGDVKFVMAIGTFTGAAGVVRVLMVTFLCYPLLAAVIIFREKKLAVTWLRFRRLLFGFLGFFLPDFKLYAMQLESSDDQSVASATTPFGVALAAGTLVSVYTDFLKYLL